MERINGRAAIKTLAKRFPQLYVAPAEGAQEAHRLASARGLVLDGASLDHFKGSEEDEYRTVETPAGAINVLFLKERKDFETFLQIISHKSKPVAIAKSIGAITYRGLADWQAVEAAKDAYVSSGGDDWAAEFARLAKVPGAFRAELIVISEGPYSSIPSADTPYDEGEWLKVSRDIRLNHECAHVVCRRLMPDDILPVWDEVTADVCGLACATGSYDSRLAATFLGVAESGYDSGRLEEYLDDSQKGRINDIAAEVFASMREIERIMSADDALHPYEFLLELKRAPMIRI